MLKVHSVIKKVMKKKKYWRSYEVQQAVMLEHKLFSESTITRRMREMGVKSHRPSGVVKHWRYSL